MNSGCLILNLDLNNYFKTKRVWDDNFRLSKGYKVPVGIDIVGIGLCMVNTKTQTSNRIFQGLEISEGWGINQGMCFREIT